MLALAAVTLLYTSYSMPWYYMVAGMISVLVFFNFGYALSRTTSRVKIKRSIDFEKRIFWIAFVPRLLFTLLIYWIFMANYGNTFGFESGDATYYNDLGQFVAGLIDQGNYHFYDEISKWSGNKDVADMGYGVYVGFLYWLLGNNILVVRLLKCVWSSLMVVLIYRLAKRNFGDQIARLAAILCALWPNFWYYCGVHLKETEMVFLSVLFVEQADQMLRSKKFTTWKVVPILLLAALLFTFRTPLGLVAILALLFAIVISSTKIISRGKKIIVGILALVLIGVTMGNRIEEQTRKLMESANTEGQSQNMAWRSIRENGNAFAKYAGAAVFAPMILTIPFPTMAEPYAGQELQELLNGGNFAKNIFSGFTILACIVLLLSGKWREHTLPLAFMLGYVVVLVMSTFAQSERFHQPVMAFELMFAAYGISIVAGQKRYRRWCIYWCVLMFMAAIAWNWFKLAGRGLA